MRVFVLLWPVSVSRASETKRRREEEGSSPVIGPKRRIRLHYTGTVALLTTKRATFNASKVFLSSRTFILSFFFSQNFEIRPHSIFLQKFLKSL